MFHVSAVSGPNAGQNVFPRQTSIVGAQIFKISMERPALLQHALKTHGDSGEHASGSTILFSSYDIVID